MSENFLAEAKAFLNAKAEEEAMNYSSGSLSSCDDEDENSNDHLFYY